MPLPPSKVACVAGLLVCGSLNTITMKIVFTMRSFDSHGEHKVFQKPWLMTFIMFFAMSLALFFDRSVMRCNPCRKTYVTMEPLLEGYSPSSRMLKPSWNKRVAMVSIPAIFDILATGLCSMGFLYIPASVWQLLRGAEMVFAAIFAVTCLGRKLHIQHWVGVAACTLGVVLVGLASVWGAPGQKMDNEVTGDKTRPKDSQLLLLGMGLALGGQIVQAAQVIAEEWLLNDLELPGPQIIGFEGVWGALLMLAIVFPLFWVLPGGDGGHFEDELDSITMLSNNKALMGLVAVYTFSCNTYNMSGIAVTGALSAVHRVMLEALRTAVVWIFGLCVHYLVDEHSPFGEKWTRYSVMEVCGFFVILIGQAIYGDMIKLPGIVYPQTPLIEPLSSPGAFRNTAAMLPAHE